MAEALATGGANYFSYDAAQRQTGQVWQAAGGSRQYFDYDYDAAGNLVGGRDARGWARYARDPLGRVVSEVAPGQRGGAYAIRAGNPVTPSKVCGMPHHV